MDRSTLQSRERKQRLQERNSCKRDNTYWHRLRSIRDRKPNKRIRVCLNDESELMLLTPSDREQCVRWMYAHFARIGKDSLRNFIYHDYWDMLFRPVWYYDNMCLYGSHHRARDITDGEVERERMWRREIQSEVKKDIIEHAVVISRLGLPLDLALEVVSYINR